MGRVVETLPLRVGVDERVTNSVLSKVVTKRREGVCVEQLLRKLPIQSLLTYDRGNVSFFIDGGGRVVIECGRR